MEEEEKRINLELYLLTLVTLFACLQATFQAGGPTLTAQESRTLRLAHPNVFAYLLNFFFVSLT